MVINLAPQLELLRRSHGSICMAVITKEDSKRYADEFTPGIGDLRFGKLADGRVTVFTRGDSGQIRGFLFMRGISYDTWVDIREEDERYEEAAYVTNMNGRFVRAQTGMLDELFGYIAVQSPRFGDTDTVIEDLEFTQSGRFDALYERIATPVHAQ